MVSTQHLEHSKPLLPNNELFCFICYDKERNEPLISSPCGKCKMHVHKSCFDTHQVHQYKKHQCVVMKTGQQTSPEDHGLVVYTSCSVCKIRYEYSSKHLLESIAQHLNTLETDDAVERNAEHRYAVICTQFLFLLIARAPAQIRDDAMAATHTIVRSLAVVSADGIIPQIKNAFCALTVSLYCATFAVGLVSLFCVKAQLCL